MASIGYPEILLAVICFLLLHRLSNSNVLPWNWPLVGMLPWIFCNIQQIQDRCTEVLEQSSGTFLLKGPWFANMDMLITSDPANVHYIMSTNFSNFPKGPEFLKIFDVLGEGIFNSDSDLWRKQRKLAQLLINGRQFQQFLVKTTQNKVDEGLIPVLEHVSKQGLLVDLQDLFQRFTFDTTCKLVTGFDTKCLSIEFPRVLFAKAMDDVEEAIFFRHVVPESLWKLQRWLGIGEEKKLSKGWETIDNVIAEYISMKNEELSKGITKLQEDEEGADLLTSYMNEDSTMELKSNKFLRDTIVNFLLAGRDTTSAALTWFFWLVSKNPLVEAKIREELKETIPEKEDQKWHIFRTEELNKLVYLHGALCETLRLYPPVPFQHKAPHQADVLPSGHRVHPKMKILFSLYAMGRMTSIWGKDCFEFKPERWITEQGGIKNEPSYKFFAFNAGPRTCLGKGVAFTQMKAVAAAIIHNYNVQLVQGHPVAPSVSIILHMKHELMVRVTKRW
ncbi:hypothetical protein PVL29_027051 [Vitis rotundifolia]|uniref:Alkane hydroxylase MAH1-like n=1 Tax=Vitis rotundifolia TaxID=103349 RepID=A0AA38YI64_VITRO|nr:hypothetical protein PVL29_027051 [Vitis rotundifolia]